MKIAHLADIHIRGYQYLDEMQFTFDKLYASLREKKPDQIIIAGDLYHSKLTVTNEYFVICRNFLRELSGIAPVDIILGNHDLALSNRARIDAISPIIDSLDTTGDNFKVCLHRHSTSFIRAGVRFHVFSIVDNKNQWPAVVNSSDYTEIALYHGSINGSKFDNEWVARGLKDEVGIFAGCDYALLGDIHKAQFLGDDYKIAYPGSLRQNSFGEETDKGYLFWDIRGKDDFDVEQVILPQQKYFYTIEVASLESLPRDLPIQPNSRIRLKILSNLSMVDEITIKEEIKSLYKPCSDVVVLPYGDKEDLSVVRIEDQEFVNENLRLPEVQEQLIRSFFQHKEISEEQLQSIVDLDKHYHAYIDGDVLRNVIWNIDNLSWENLFSYGPNNSIDFKSISGLIGVFGRNGIGKSSIFDVINYAIFNSINKKGANKNVDYINAKRKAATASVAISCNNETYSILRSTEKSETKKGEEKALNIIDFGMGDKPQMLNGETIPDTNKNIKTVFGTLEDFNTISIIPQFSLSSFIDLGGTERKRLLARFLDLDIFDIKFKYANDDSKALKSKISDFNSADFNLIAQYQQTISRLKADIEKYTKYKDLAYVEMNSYTARVAEANLSIQKIKDLPSDASLKVEQLTGQYSSMTAEILKLQEKLIFWQEELADNSGTSETEAMTNVLELTQIYTKRQTLDQERTRLEQDAELLSCIPNVPECRTCPLATNAFASQNKIPAVASELTSLPDVSRSDVESAKKLLGVLKQIDQIQLEITTTQGLNNQTKQSLEDLLRVIKENSEIIQSNKTAQDLASQYSEKIGEFKKSVAEIDLLLATYIKELGSVEARLEGLQEKRAEFVQLHEKSAVLQLYLDAMGKNGIAYSILSQKLPTITNEANHILAQVVPYRLLIQDNDEEKSIKIFMIDGTGKRPIELASGSEKTIFSLALRAALWNICCLPKPSFLVLDEPFGYLDDQKLDSVINLLQYLKNYFSHLFVITHDENLKNIVDTIFYVEEVEGFAHIKI